jgi:hypothetical protein
MVLALVSESLLPNSSMSRLYTDGGGKRLRKAVSTSTSAASL